MVIVTGGPQYRVGSHRQFVLLARDLAAHGIAALRFDCRGMGDSDGEFPGFEHIEPDVAAAVAAMKDHVPTLKQMALWALCDGTTGVCRYASRDPRLAGIVLLNPWVRTDEGYARTQLKHYYLARLFQRDLLRKIISGRFDLAGSARALLGNVKRAAGGRRSTDGGGASNPLAERMAADLQRFNGRLLVVLSGRDLTAKEFVDAAQSSKDWQRIYAREKTARHHLVEADHTFSRRTWRDEVAAKTAAWIKGWS